MRSLVQSSLLGSVFLFGFSLFAEIEHQGIVGGPFHGYASDDTNQTRVQIGPLADFNVPDGLSARSLNNRIPSGGSAGLEASLLRAGHRFGILIPVY